MAETLTMCDSDASFTHDLQCQGLDLCDMKVNVQIRNFTSLCSNETKILNETFTSILRISCLQKPHFRSISMTDSSLLYTTLERRRKEDGDPPERSEATHIRKCL